MRRVLTLLAALIVLSPLAFVRESSAQITNPVCGGGATLTWTPPTTNTDGSTLTNLAGYRVHIGTATRTYTQTFSLQPGLSAYVVTGLCNGTYYFAITAFNSAVPVQESAFSNEAIKTVTGFPLPPKIPAAPGNLQVT